MRVYNNQSENPFGPRSRTQNVAANGPLPSAVYTRRSYDMYYRRRRHLRQPTAVDRRRRRPRPSKRVFHSWTRENARTFRCPNTVRRSRSKIRVRFLFSVDRSNVSADYRFRWRYYTRGRRETNEMSNVRPFFKITCRTRFRVRKSGAGKITRRRKN